MWLVGRSRSGIRSPVGSTGTGGFTLLELIAVVAVVGVALSVAMPSLSTGLQRWRMRVAVREMSAMIKFARNQAVARRQSLQIVVDRSRNSFWLDRATVRQDAEQAEEKGLRLYALPDGVRFGTVTVGGLEVENPQFGLLFAPNGSTRADTVQILDANGRGYRIVLDQVTGQASIQRMDH